MLRRFAVCLSETKGKGKRPRLTGRGRFPMCEYHRRGARTLPKRLTGNRPMAADGSLCLFYMLPGGRSVPRAWTIFAHSSNSRSSVCHRSYSDKEGSPMETPGFR